MIYLVKANTGEYGEYNEWIVAVYTNEEQAKEHVRLANKHVAGAENKPWGERKLLQKTNLYDPQCRIDYTGTEYEVKELLLVNTVDQFLQSKP